MENMASPKAVEISAAELEIKRRGRRRLIGAVTIGLLAIVFLPMIFDSEPERNKAASKSGSQEISIQIPPKEGLPPLPAPSTASSTSVAPKVPTAAPTPAPTAPPVASVVPAEQKPATVSIPTPPPEPAPKVATKVESVKPEKKPEPVAAPLKPVEAKAETKQGFVVQVGAFKDLENTKQIVAQAKTANLPVYTDTVATANGTVTRVRVGPFSTKQKADAALAQLKLSGSDGKIVPLQ
jgi:DedD protein